MIQRLTSKARPTLAVLTLILAAPISSTFGQPALEKPAASRVDKHGDPLPAGALARLGTIRLRPGYAVNSVLFSDDGNSVITCGKSSPDITFWDPNTSHLKRTLTCHLTEADFTRLGKPLPKPPGAPDFDDPYTLNAEFIALAPNSVVLAEITKKSSIWLWDLATGRPLGDLQVPEMGKGDLRSICFSPDGKTLVGVGHGSRICEWDVQTRKLRQEFGARDFYRVVAFSLDGKAIACGNSEFISLWDFATKKQLWSDQNLFTNSATSLAFSRDGKSLITGRLNGLIRILETASGKEKVLIKGHDWSVNSVAISPDGRLLASGANDAVIRIWDLATGKLIRECHGNCGEVRAVTFSPDGKILASGSDDRSLRFWNVESGEERFPLPGHRGLVLSLAYSPDGRSLASVSSGDGLRIWSLARMEEARPFIPIKEAWRVAVAPDSRTIAVSRFNEIVLCDASSGKELRTLQGHSQRIYAIQFLPDGKNLVSVCSEGPVHHWRVSDGKGMLHSSGSRSELHGDRPFFSPDARLLATSGGIQKVSPVPGEQSFVRLHDTDPAMDPANIKGQNAANKLLSFQTKAFSLDGEILATTDSMNPQRLDRGSIFLWNTRSGEFVRSLDYGHKSGSELAISTDGRVVASTCREVVYLWEVASGQEIQVWPGQSSHITSVAFANDGRILASGGLDGSILEWDCTCGNGRGSSPDQKATSEQLYGWWHSLSRTADEAEPARWKLVDAGQQGVEFLAKRLVPGPTISAERIRTLIGDLGADSFVIRDRAQTELGGVAELAKPALKEFLSGQYSPEVKRRAQQLMKDLEIAYFKDTRAVSVLASIGSPDAMKLLRTLAKGQPGARLTMEAEKACRRLDNKRVNGATVAR